VSPSGAGPGRPVPVEHAIVRSSGMPPTAFETRAVQARCHDVNSSMDACPRG
jgi:hypothetical protein